jgi:hypothetical protein
MIDPGAFVDRYVAVWHEPDEEERRKAIAELWAPDGSYLDPLNDVRGHKALQEVVTAVYEEFIQSGESVFRSRHNAQSHHNLIRFNWERVRSAADEVIDTGFDMLVLDDDDHIVADYKFFDPAEIGGELNAFTDRYVRVWQEPDEEERRKAITELWAPTGGQIYPAADGEVSGYDALQARVTRSYNLFNKAGEYQFRSKGDANGHHNVVRFNWAMIRTDTGEAADVGFELFVLDDDGRILSDYQFVGPAE